ncbi:hypothetical protein JKF63_05648 [Porcisia hertigi]|uniref:Uncharacterized protein n=1 Tax=Porcisia hertigi TaxID=2761500 RepID=A0A836ILM1_9TRYP|nr:hypothetical protein JKF63_05648 [Porcisia hertigi]
MRPSLPSLRKSIMIPSTPRPRTRDDTSNGNRVSFFGGAATGLAPISGLPGTLRSTQPSNSVLSLFNSELSVGSSRAPPNSRDDALLASLLGTDLAVTKAAATDYYNQYKEVAAENAKLRASLRQHEVDSVQVVQFLESKLKEVQIEAQAYKMGITRLLDDHHSAEKELQSQYAEMVRERDVELTHYASVTSKLQDDLRQASRYVQQRQEHTVELQQLQKQLDDLVVQHEAEMASLHFQTVDRKLKLIALEKTMRAEFEALVEARAATALEERFQRVLDRTRQLEEEKVSMAHNIHNLMHLTADIDADRVQVRRQAEVQQQANKELAHHAMARKKQREQADVKIYELEEQVRELTAQQQVMRAQLKETYQSRIDALEAELKATRASLQIHRADLQNMRQLTARVVGERSELENFFHTALADCQRYRQEMAASCHASIAPPAPGALSSEIVQLSCPPNASDESGLLTQEPGATVAAVVSPAASTLGTTLKNSGAFFEELPWKDKEKVIKSLLFFINANYYKSLSGAPTATGGGTNLDGHLAS